MAMSRISTSSTIFVIQVITAALKFTSCSMIFFLPQFISALASFLARLSCLYIIGRMKKPWTEVMCTISKQNKNHAHHQVASLKLLGLSLKLDFGFVDSRQSRADFLTLDDPLRRRRKYRKRDCILAISFMLFTCMLFPVFEFIMTHPATIGIYLSRRRRIPVRVSASSLAVPTIRILPPTHFFTGHIVLCPSCPVPHVAVFDTC